MLVFAVVIQILHLFNNSSAQDLKVTIKFDAEKPQIVIIEGKRSTGIKPSSRNLSFLTSSAGQEISGERISNLKLFDSKGAAVHYKRFMPGEYVADDDFLGWSYQVDLTPPKDQKLMARISWRTNSLGILMFEDLLPRFSKNENVKSAEVTLDLWQGNRITTAINNTEKPVGHPKIFVEDITKWVFHFGDGWEVVPAAISTGSGFYTDIGYKPYPLMMFFSGEFQFNRNKALDIAVEIYQDYQKKLGDKHPPKLESITIVKFPFEVRSDTWEAETRGKYITLLTSDTSFRSQVLQQLHEQLRHEIFHLWIPNGVNLSGNYDWFYEGFALYQSLKTGVALNRIQFDDYLDTLSRAYDVDKRLEQKLSLIEVSKNRWAGDNNTRVYARGMLVAFLCDLALLEKSKGKRSVTDLLRQLYERHKPPAAEHDGNAAVLALLRSHNELTPIIDKNITGSESIDWNTLIKAVGLETDPANQTASLKVTAKPTGRQKDLLDKLGYNNWRKLLSK